MGQQEGTPRAPRDGDRPQEDGADDYTQRVRVAEHYSPRRESEALPRKSGGRTSRSPECSCTIEAALGAPAWRRRQGRREHRTTATAPREESTAPTTTRREREPPGTTRHAEGPGRRREREASELHSPTSAAARLSRHQER